MASKPPSEPWAEFNHQVNHPSHYANDNPAYEAIEVIKANGWLEGFCKGNAYRYLARAGRKEGEPELKDIGKAVWYLNYWAAHIERLKHWNTKADEGPATDAEVSGMTRAMGAPHPPRTRTPPTSLRAPEEVFLPPMPVGYGLMIYGKCRGCGVNQEVNHQLICLACAESPRKVEFAPFPDLVTVSRYSDDDEDTLANGGGPQ